MSMVMSSRVAYWSAIRGMRLADSMIHSDPSPNALTDIVLVGSLDTFANMLQQLLYRQDKKGSLIAMLCRACV